MNEQFSTVEFIQEWLNFPTEHRRLYAEAIWYLARQSIFNTQYCWEHDFKPCVIQKDQNFSFTYYWAKSERAQIFQYIQPWSIFSWWTIFAWIPVNNLADVKYIVNQL